jgi:hypothetical protein
VRAVPARLAGAVHHIVRAQRRMPVFGKARLRRDGLPDLALSLRNVSRSGFMVELSEHIPAGSRVRLIIPFAGAVTADVRWSHNHRMGCRLTRDFSTRQLAVLLLFVAPRSLPAELKMLAVTLGALAFLILS